MPACLLSRFHSRAYSSPTEPAEPQEQFTTSKHELLSTLHYRTTAGLPSSLTEGHWIRYGRGQTSILMLAWKPIQGKQGNMNTKWWYKDKEGIGSKFCGVSKKKNHGAYSYQGRRTSLDEDNMVKYHCKKHAPMILIQHVYFNQIRAWNPISSSPMSRDPLHKTWLPYVWVQQAGHIFKMRVC